uniref:YoaK family protein n=1 Tax=Sphingomonas bacterium TaxID=1895847 RepID=UPI002611C6F5|nr:YoaK family protein [Sphingomonas bacterium]
MQSYRPPMIALAVCLAALAGFVDALAFSSLGGFFASFMSGNTTRLGVSFATGRMDEVRMAGALILSFVSGVMIATVIGRRWPKRQQAAVMIAVTALLGLAAAIMQIRPDTRALLLLAAAMGAENGLFTREGEVSIGLTYMTGSLVKMGQRLAGALMGDADRWTWARYLMLWLGFVCGVVMGARCYGAYDNGALWLATGGAAVLTIVVAAMAGRAEREGPWGARAA